MPILKNKTGQADATAEFIQEWNLADRIHFICALTQQRATQEIMSVPVNFHETDAKRSYQFGMLRKKESIVAQVFDILMGPSSGLSSRSTDLINAEA